MDPMHHHQIPTPPSESPVHDKAPVSFEGYQPAHNIFPNQGQEQQPNLNRQPSPINTNVTEKMSNMVQNAAQAIQNNPTVQNAVGGAQTQYKKTANEISSLGYRSPPPPAEEEPEQYLTHFHNFFYDLFTWKFPRATGITFGVLLSTIVAFHYVNVLRYVFKGMYLLFAASAVAEFAGKPLGMQGFVSQIRPRRYATVPRDAIESIFAELHELLNFFVLEFQQLLFAENLFATIVAFVVSFIGYVAVKYISAWTLLLIGSIIAFTAPPLYLQNQEVIDDQIRQMSEIVNEKMTLARSMGEKYANDAASQARVAASNLSTKVNELATGAKQNTLKAKEAVEEKAQGLMNKEKEVREEDFPNPPVQSTEEIKEQDTSVPVEKEAPMLI